MLRRPPRSTRTDTLFPYTTLFRSAFNAVDFDDLIRLPLQLLEADPELAAAWRERIRYLLVDECQDTNGAQYRLLRQLAGPRGAITCVGDDDQSIYAWRGAQPENLDLLARDYRSEEHTSELQSLMRISYAVFCLKKNTTTKQ